MVEGLMDLIHFVSGGIIFVGVFYIGLIAGRKQVDPYYQVFPKTEEAPSEKPAEEIYDDEYFEKALRDPEEGGLQFPTDEELDFIHRHSMG